MFKKKNYIYIFDSCVFDVSLQTETSSHSGVAVVLVKSGIAFIKYALLFNFEGTNYKQTK